MQLHAALTTLPEADALRSGGQALSIMRRPPGGGTPPRPPAAQPHRLPRRPSPTQREAEIRRRQQQQQQQQLKWQQLRQHQEQQEEQQEQPPQLDQENTQSAESLQPRVPSPRAAGKSRRTLHTAQQQTDDAFEDLMIDADLDPSWRLQVSLLYQIGLRADQFRRLASSRPEVFQMGLSNMKRKLRFLRDVVGLSEDDLVKVLTRFPRVLEYESERTLRPRLDFLTNCGVAQQDLPKVVVRAPMVLELSIADTLQPRAEFLREEVELPPSSLGKLILRHPQVLHYKIESMRERVAYLASIGMQQEQVAAAIARFPQLFSLNVAANMAPKWRYLVEHLGGDVSTLCAYPGYFSLSLNNRIIPRHRFFVQQVKPEASIPFPLGHLKCSDKKFAVDICSTTLAEYSEFLASQQPADA